MPIGSLKTMVDTHRSVGAAAITLVLLGGLVSEAGAQEQASSARLTSTMERYFDGEKREGYVFLAVGNAALAAGGALLASRLGGASDLGRGFAWPLLAVGVIEFCAGVVLLARTDERVLGLRAEIARDPMGFRARERARIDRVNFWFRVLKVTESALAGVGAVAAVAGAATGYDTLFGAGAGLALQAAIMLTLDSFAERRAHRYADGLTSVSVSVGGRHEEPVLLLSLVRRF